MPEFDPNVVDGSEQLDDGVRFDIRCFKCGQTTSVTMRYADPLGTNYPITCRCGAKSYLVTGGPRTGKDLLEAVKNAPPNPKDLSKRCPPGLN